LAAASSVASISSRTSSWANTWSQRRARTRSISAIRSAGRVLLLCADVAKQAWPQVVVFYCIYAPDILIVFPRKISLTRFCARRDVFRYPEGGSSSTTAATAHSGLYADTMRILCGYYADTQFNAYQKFLMCQRHKALQLLTIIQLHEKYGPKRYFGRSPPRPHRSWSPSSRDRSAAGSADARACRQNGHGRRSV
jgi:hypothetical protein